MNDLVGQFFLNSGIILLRYFILCALFFLMFYVLFKNRLKHRKLQASYPAGANHRRDIFYSVVTTLIFGFIFACTITLLSPYTLIYEAIEEHGFYYYLLSFLLMAIIHDTWFYWTHRLIHTKQLFKYVHLVHHRSNNPTPWTAYAFHPLEAVLQALVLPLIAFLIPVHISALVIYFFFQFLHNIYGHLGFEILPGMLRNSSPGRQLNTAIVHNKHHASGKGNYGLYFLFWDKLMGTYRK